VITPWGRVLMFCLGSAGVCRFVHFDLLHAASGLTLCRCPSGSVPVSCDCGSAAWDKLAGVRVRCRRRFGLSVCARAPCLAPDFHLSDTQNIFYTMNHDDAVKAAFDLSSVVSSCRSCLTLAVGFLLADSGCVRDCPKWAWLW
jgi:hypothetical protein